MTVNIGDYDIKIEAYRIGGGWQASSRLPDGKEIISAPKSNSRDAIRDVIDQAKARLYTQRSYDVNRPSESFAGDKRTMQIHEKKKFLKQAINKKHKGYCTPMSKKTCTPHRKALARRFKAGGDLHHESIEEAADSLIECPPELVERKLSYQARQKLPSKDFVFPGKRKYPIEDKPHARNALSRVSTFGSPSEKKAVRSAVHSKYPEIGESEGAIVAHQANTLLEAYDPNSYEIDSETGADVNRPRCPNCGSPGEATDQDGSYVCGGCGSPFRADLTKHDSSLIRRSPLSPPKAAFYPSDGGSAGGGGGITSV